ncbi:MAG TPA: 5-formyltetrahydrofolate cyclo-ligase [Eubacteriaceae bacterium]|nr:5-formyltetrahydrofolate cyclo-ligase [Eubacteriaceae bacterium]
MDKRSLRKELKKKRAAFSEDYVQSVSKKIFDRIEAMPEYQNSDTIMIYVSYDKEIHTHDFIVKMLEQGKNVVTPICNNENNTLTLGVTKTFPHSFKVNSFGILELDRERAETTVVDEIDMVITPGLAFTADGKRLGYGAGFYDRLLAGKKDTTPTVCPVYEEFILDDIPVDPHDRNVDYLVTDQGVYKTKQ